MDVRLPVKDQHNKPVVDADIADQMLLIRFLRYYKNNEITTTYSA